MNIKWLFVLCIVICTSCDKGGKSIDVIPMGISVRAPYIAVLTLAQDDGYAQINNKDYT